MYTYDVRSRVKIDNKYVLVKKKYFMYEFWISTDFKLDFVLFQKFYR